MKMNDAHPTPDYEVKHAEAEVKVKTTPPIVHVSQHLNLEVPTLEVKAES